MCSYKARVWGHSMRWYNYVCVCEHARVKGFTHIAERGTLLLRPFVRLCPSEQFRGWRHNSPQTAAEHRAPLTSENGSQLQRKISVVLKVSIVPAEGRKHVAVSHCLIQFKVWIICFSFMGLKLLPVFVSLPSFSSVWPVNITSR